MKTQKKIGQWLCLGLVLMFSACGGQTENQAIDIHENKMTYAFVVAGHVYGNPDSYTESVYPPFLASLDSLNRVSPINQLILTGDVVKDSTAQNWTKVQQELDALNVEEWHIAPGNHDVGSYLETHIQAEKYMAHAREKNLFMILNTSNPGWTVDSLQRIFIKSSLATYQAQTPVFVFSHQLWWEKNPPSNFELDAVRPNSFALFDGDSNFWEDAFPFFEEIEREIYFFAGDMGSDPSLEAYYEDHHDRFHFYGSGMGGGLADNFLYVQLFQDGTVKIERVNF